MSVRNIITILISIIKLLNGLSKLQDLNLVELLNEWQNMMIWKIYEFVPFLNVLILVPTVWQLYKNFYSLFQMIWNVYCTHIYRKT